MLKDDRLKACPFCGKKPLIYVCDNEGNIHNDEYIDNPWSGLSFAICHVADLGVDNSLICPIASFEAEMVGTQLYDSIDELVERWNNRLKD